MIRRLQLRNWRAYENLDLELGPGATFVVASNGIGKTSLIMGASWGLFGDAAHVTAVEEIRGDADEATVGVELRLPSGADLTITRTINRKAKVKLKAELSGRKITSQDELNELLTTEFGAEPHVLAQLTVMVHGAAEMSQTEFDLQDHLAGVFGVTPLFEAARTAQDVADRAASALRKVKTTQRTEKRAKDDIVVELQSVIEELSTTNEARGVAAAAVNEVMETIRGGDEWTRFRAGMAERDTQLGALAEQATSLLDRTVAAATVLDVLTQVEQDISEAIATAENAAASARGKSELIEAALSDLQGAGATCPTCLRPLSEHDADHAGQEHTKHLQELAKQRSEAEATAARERDALKDVKGLLQQVRALPMPLEPETQIDEAALTAAQTDLERRKEEVQTLDKKLAVLSTSGASLQESLRQLEEDEEKTRELEALYRQEAIALATHDSLVQTGNAITEKYIEPLAGEVENRWKTMFGTGGLNLSSEGRITRQLGGRTLEFGSLSGGEKVWALLLTRLLIAGASTQAPFIWLDEPLEHLDPKLRKIVAGTLAKASSGTGIRQVIVTTYENELARQLMEDVPSASLLYVSASA